MIQTYFFNKKKFSFLRPYPGSSAKNTFTIIVGKNGTGKSTLLRSMVIDLLRDNVAPSTLKNVTDISSQDREDKIGKFSFKWLPKKIVCVSTSPFDKFPILKRNQEIPFYSYLGLRGLPSQNLGPAYMARIIYTLISSSQQNREHANAIATVLEYLDYYPEIRILSTTSSPRLIDILAIENDAESRTSIKVYFDRGSPTSGENLALRNISDVDDKTFRQIRKAVFRLIEGPKKRPIFSILSRDSSGSPSHPNILADDLSLLSRFGLVRLKEVELLKKNAPSPIKMSDMSSGEQSVIMGLLGIGSQLQDDALICIDEPEVCLHPAWQERYIQLLSSIFSHYRGCHFFIATHSPQIVAQLPEGRCYVMDMEDGIARPSSEFSLKSIDYQLASLFNAPGFKNEYLSRIALSIFINVSKEKVFNEEVFEDYNSLVKIYDFLRADDPLREIIDSIQEMFKVYGRH